MKPSDRIFELAKEIAKTRRPTEYFCTGTPDDGEWLDAIIQYLDETRGKDE